jgi:acetyl esterase/lipase
MTLSLSPIWAQLPSQPPEIASQSVWVDHYPSRQVSFPNGVKGIPSVVYWTPIGYRPLTLDLYLPPATLQRPTQGFPWVVYIHGGGWEIGDSHRSGPFVDFAGVLASLSARGYIVASIEYRLSGEAVFPAQIRDVKAAIRWLRSHASEYGIDPARAITWGASAGGHLASLAAVSCNVQALEPAQTRTSGAPNMPPDAIISSHVSDCVQGSVTWYGEFDFATIATQASEDKAKTRNIPDAPEWRMLGCFASECKNGQIAAASPITYVALPAI